MTRWLSIAIIVIVSGCATMSRQDVIDGAVEVGVTLIGDAIWGDFLWP